jgi:hypothetical protein
MGTHRDLRYAQHKCQELAHVVGWCVQPSDCPMWLGKVPPGGTKVVVAEVLTNDRTALPFRAFRDSV